MIRPDILTSCKHSQTITDVETSERVCTECGMVVQIVDVAAPKAPNDRSAIVSAGMIHPLGSDVDIQALNRAKLLKGALRDLFDGTDKKTFWIRFTEELKAKGYSEGRIAQ